MTAVFSSVMLQRTDLDGRLRAMLLGGAAALALVAAPVHAQTTSLSPTQPPAQTQPSTGSGAASSSNNTQPSNQTNPPGQAAQPGVRAVNPATLRITFYTVQAADMLASQLIGLNVRNLQNEEVGEIEDLVVDNGKTVRGVVIGVGGFLGIGERHTVVDPGSIVVTREPGGSLKAVVNTTRDDLKNAPEFKFEGNMKKK